MQIPDNAPFTPEQREQLNQMITALSPEQKVYLSGLLTTVPKTELTILFGTESGNCEELADRTAKLAKQQGFKPKVVNVSETDTKALTKVENLLVIISTWGEGDPPDTATDFHNEIMGDKAAKFSNTNFSVCALGDTSYEQFCEIGIQFDNRLEALGAKRVYDRQDCDVDFEDDWNKWATNALKAFPGAAQNVAVAAPSATVAPVVYNRKNPLMAEVKTKILLNGTGSAKETLHIELGLEGSGMEYEVGDALALIPENCDIDVNRILEVSGVSGSAKLGDISLAEALKKNFDITSLTSRIADKYNKLANNEALAKATEDKKAFGEWAWGRQLVDLLEEYPCKDLTPESLTSIMRKMAPRLYSIASSLKAHEEEVHLTIAAVRYDTHGKERVGVASTYVADFLNEDDRVPVWVHKNKNFRLPEDNNTDVIMIGPGTGIAPFRAFIEELSATSAPGKSWLFFGDQHYSYDFLYQLEWKDYLKDGVLDKLDVAFSRDQPEKVYVQDKLRESAEELYKWIEGGAHIYVCGDANRMAHDVNTALIEIIAEHGKKSTEDAEAFLAELKKSKRYQRDVY